MHLAPPQGSSGVVFRVVFRFVVVVVFLRCPCWCSCWSRGKKEVPWCSVPWSEDPWSRLGRERGMILLRGDLAANPKKINPLAPLSRRRKASRSNANSRVQLPGENHGHIHRPRRCGQLRWSSKTSRQVVKSQSEQETRTLTSRQTSNNGRWDRSGKPGTGNPNPNSGGYPG